MRRENMSMDDVLRNLNIEEEAEEQESTDQPDLLDQNE
jgi:hypothetical protein